MNSLNDSLVISFFVFPHIYAWVLVFPAASRFRLRLLLLASSASSPLTTHTSMTHIHQLTHINSHIATTNNNSHISSTHTHTHHQSTTHTHINSHTRHQSTRRRRLVWDVLEGLCWLLVAGRCLCKCGVSLVRHHSYNHRLIHPTQVDQLSTQEATHTTNNSPQQLISQLSTPSPQHISSPLTCSLHVTLSFSSSA